MSTDERQTRRAKVNDEANALFDRIGSLVQKQLNANAKEIDVVALLDEAGLRVSTGTLEELGVPAMLLPHTFLPWHDWFPWKPLWSYFFSLHFPGSVAARAYIPGQVAGAATRAAVGGTVGFNGLLPPMP
ncbi:hypothetical protein ACMHYB_17235 [Sorangium sp. So ce1128]